MKSLFFLALLASTTAHAMDDSAILQKLSPAWVSLEKKTVALVGPEYHHIMVDAAFASVAVSACPGLAFKGDEVDRRFTQLVSEKGGKTPEDQRQFIIKSSTLYGAYLGLLIAESHLDTVAFCRYVEKAKTQPGGPSLFWSVK